MPVSILELNNLSDRTGRGREILQMAALKYDSMVGCVGSCIPDRY